MTGATLPAMGDSKHAHSWMKGETMEDCTKHKQALIATYVERCNCGDRIMHNNGGNYHDIITWYSSNDGVVEETYNTRELFDNDEEKECEICGEEYYSPHTVHKHMTSSEARKSIWAVEGYAHVDEMNIYTPKTEE